MIIGIDNVSTGLSTSPMPLGGMRMYLNHFVTSLLKWGPQHKYILFSPDWFESPFGQNTPNFRDIRVGNVPVNRLGRVAFEQLNYRQAIYRHKPDVFVGLHNTLPWGLKVPSVIFIKSTQYLFFPGAYSLVRLLYLRLIVHLSVRWATSVIVPTRSVGDDVVRVLRISPGKIEVLPEALYPLKTNVLQSPDGETLRQKIVQFTGGRPFVLCVGATYGYKNLDRLVNAFARFRTVLGSEHVLLLIGGEAAVSFEHIKAVARAAGVDDKVVCCGSLPHVEVIAAYNLADMMVMPSLYETFGHPVLEAMACGCPVVTSNVSAMPEVAGDAAELVDPYHTRKIADGMLRLARDEAHRTQLVELGRRRAAEFSWERTACHALEILEKTKVLGTHQ